MTSATPSPRLADPVSWHWQSLAVPLTAAVGLWLLVDPTGEFPLNDDWAYTSSVRHLLEEGRLVLSDWASPAALPQIALGTLMTWPVGLHYVLLRASTVLWAVLGVVCLDRLLAGAGVRPAVRWLAAIVIFLNPIAFVVTFSFHSDIAFVSLVIGCLYCFQRAEHSGRARAEVLFGCVAAVACVSRQVGVLIPLAALVWLAVHRRLSAGRALRVGGPPAVALTLFYVWFLTVHGPTWASVNYLVFSTVRHAGRPLAFLGAALQRSLDSCLYAMLFASPWVFIRASAPARPGTRVRWVLVVASVLLLIYAYARGPFPYLGNTFHRHGLGALTIYDAHSAKPAFLWQSSILWAGLGVVAVLSFLNAVWRYGPPRWTVDEARIAFLGLPPALAMVVGEFYLDRYVLGWIVTVTLVLALRCRQSRPGIGAWVLAAVWVGLVCVGTRDYFAWNRAKWQLGEQAQALGFRPEEVALGFDWNAHWKYEKNMAELKRQKPLSEIGLWEWQRPELVRGVVAYSPELQAGAETFRSVAQVRYVSPLAPQGAEIHLVIRQGSAPP